MPVYNAQLYLHEAISSILSQSFEDFEFLIYNDGSTDRSKEIIESFNDARIIFIDFSFNQGIVALLNMGLQRARGKYIARMDADDIAHPDRFQKQYDFMEENNEYVLCGTRFNVMGKKEVTQLPLDNDDIKSKMLFITPFCHPSVMMRVEVLQRHKILYNEAYVLIEDHELWCRLSDYGKFANLPETLLQYRVHDDNISLKKRTQQQIENFYKVRINYIINFFGESIGPTDASTLYTLFFKESNFTYEELLTCGELLQKIIKADNVFPVPSQKAHALLAEKFFYRCTTSTDLGLRSFLLTNKFDFVNPSLTAKFKLLIKALLKYKGVN
jgi:glycosyltransferase involved in cell wall biosynthesis